MMEKLITGLMIATISGITFIAYKHPEGYRNIHPFIGMIPALAFIFAVIWNWAVVVTAQELHVFIASENLSKAREAREQLEWPVGWIFLANAGIYLYTLFLLNLPKILEIEKKEKQ